MLPTADCSLDNETAYLYKDCDGTFGTTQEAYWDGVAANLVTAASVEDSLVLADPLGITYGPARTVGRNLDAPLPA